MMTPTESVVIANIMNIRKVSALMAARLLFGRHRGMLDHLRSSVLRPTSIRCRRLVTFSLRRRSRRNHGCEARQVDVEPCPFRVAVAIPAPGAHRMRGSTVNSPGECAVLVAEADEFQKAPHDGALQIAPHFFGRVVVPVDIPSRPRFAPAGPYHWCPRDKPT